MKKLFFPLGLMAMRQLDATAYDVILMSSTYCAKYVKVAPGALVINYCHQPFRLAWYPESYAEFVQAKGLKKLVLRSVIAALQHYDFKAAQRTNYFIANTQETSEKIKDKYKAQGEIEVIYPPVNSKQFYVSAGQKNYYLMVTRLEYYKRVDLAIDAFNQTGLPLLIVGTGTKESELKSKAKNNIIFKSGLSGSKLSQLYAECRAFIFPQHEDFGITPLEANASGRPVIAYGAGGVLNTMIPLQDTIEKSTAIFFQEQKVEALLQAIKQMEEIYLEFNSDFIRKNALRFDESAFIQAIQNFVNLKYQTHFKNFISC
ncbi:glycosyltransferase [Adhaeribacter swui]|uniref:Glycosyltransferase n=2 Tax=Adhaeribacter swui TaxID=2086471 RepID=A0A7G7GFH2_9BACT|nr:glycosyltransferase [Adhaeribacter swui]